MDYGHGRIRMKSEGDRLSILPDELIHKILSFISCKHAIQTSILTSRWRFIWSSLPYLNFSSDDFLSLSELSKFVTHLLSRRNNQSEVSSVKLMSFCGTVTNKNIINYAFSHNIQHLSVTCLLEKKKNEFPLSLFRSKSLKYLSLIGSNTYPVTAISAWELPALTTLNLEYITLSTSHTDLFSKCVRLKNLTLSCCPLKGSNRFNICHPQLCNLSIVNKDWKHVHVVAPQLRYLNVRELFGMYTITAPQLVSLIYTGYSPVIYFANSFGSFEKVSLCIYEPENEHPLRIVSLLQQLHTVKSLTLNLEIIEFLSSCLELISPQPYRFANIKCVKVYPLTELEHSNEKVTMSANVKDYLVDCFPSATITMI